MHLSTHFVARIRTWIEIVLENLYLFYELNVYPRMTAPRVVEASLSLSLYSTTDPVGVLILPSRSKIRNNFSAYKIAKNTLEVESREYSFLGFIIVVSSIQTL